MQARRFAPARRDDERGFTALEVVIVTCLLGLVLAFLLSTVVRATETAAFAQRRNASLDDLRLAAAQFTKDARQGTGVTSSTPSAFTFGTYVDAAVHEVTWRVRTVNGEDQLERLVDGTIWSIYVVDLVSPSVFTFEGERVTMVLATRPDERNPSVSIDATVEMRNA